MEKIEEPVKILMILLVGLPFTCIYVMPLIFLDLMLIVGFFGEKFFEFDNSEEVFNSLIMFYTGIFGVSGLIWFWVWAVTDVYNASRKKLKNILIFIGLGIPVSFPFFMSYLDILNGFDAGQGNLALSTLGVVAGLSGIYIFLMTLRVFLKKNADAEKKVSM